MHLAQDFSADFHTLTAGLSPDYRGPAYALSRFADGESAILFGGFHSAKRDGWQWSGPHETHSNQYLADGLQAALTHNEEGWLVGITAEEHHPRCHRRLLGLLEAENSTLDNTPPLPSRLTFAEIFHFANFQKFTTLDLSHCFTVGCGRRADWRVPATPQDEGWPQAIETTLTVLSGVETPILVAAGPWAKILILNYWRETPIARRQVILDVGSALTLRVKGRRCRRFQIPGHVKSDWVPRWKM